VGEYNPATPHPGAISYLPANSYRRRKTIKVFFTPGDMFSRAPKGGRLYSFTIT